jgi:hypothetical protein
MSANAEQVLKFNRGHWSVESHHYLSGFTRLL